jgi:plasmid maintenance system killer protein
MEIVYLPIFVRKYNKLDPKLQEEIIEKVELFKDIKNHKLLKVHRLKGRLSGHYSLSVNYKIRVVFSYLSKKEVVFLTVGDHSVYDK